MLIVPNSGEGQAAAQLPSSQKPVSYTIPFRSLSKNDILIPVMLNEKQFWFLLDTGTVRDVVLDVWAARLLHLSQEPPEPPLLPEDYHETLGLLKSLKMPFEDTPRTNVRVTIAHLSDHSPAEQGKVAGIIGVPALEGRSLTIDYLHKTLTIINAPSPLVAEATAVLLPMTWQPGGYYVTVTAKNGRHADLCVDTGSDVTVLPGNLVQGLPFTGVQSCVYTKADGTELLIWEVLLSQLSLGSFCETKVPAGVAAPDEGFLLGTDMLRRFVVTLDFQNQQMRLRRAEDYVKQSAPTAWIHAFVAKRQGKYYVKQVQWGFESKYPGLHEGDQILTVDGVPPDATLFDQDNYFSPGLEGSKVVLQVQHGHANPRQVICSRRTDYTPLATSQHGLFGYILRKKFHKPITVEAYWRDTNVVPQIPLGSSILRIERVAVSPLTLADVQPILLTPKMRINIIKPSGVAANIDMK